MYFTATFVASLLVSASALATPHIAHGMNRRHQHAAMAKVRAAAPDPVAEPIVASAAIPKRQLKKRCKARNSSALSSASSTAASSSPAPSPSSAPVNVAPDPSSSSSSSSSSSPSPSPSPPPPPPTTSTKAKTSSAPATTSQAAPSPTSSGSQSGGLFSGTQVGDGTFYGTGLGACGITNADTDFIAAVSEILFDSYPGYNGVNPNTNPVCGKKVSASYGGHTVSVTITDRCTGCAATDLDFSPSAFDVLADPSIGRIHSMSWTWQ